MEKLRILFGSKKDLSREPKMYEATKQAYKGMIERTGKYEVETFEMAFTKELLSVKIQSGNFNTLITIGAFDVKDKDGNDAKDSVGVGSLKIWKGLCPDMKFYIMEDESLKGGMKMLKLFRDASYYDAVIIKEDDKTGQILEKLTDRMLNPRTAEEAFEAYGLASNGEAVEYVKKNFPHILGEEEKEELVMGEILNDEPISSINIGEMLEEFKEDSGEAVIGEHEQAEEVIEEREAEDKDVEAMLEESMEMFSDMDSYDMDTGVEESKGEKGAFEEFKADVDGPAPGFGFGFTSYKFGEEKNDSLPEGVREISSEVITQEELGPTPEEIEEENKRLRDEKLVEELCEQSEKDLEEVMKMDARRAAVKEELVRMNDCSVPVKGRIIKIMDEDTIMIEFLEDVSLEGDFDEYKCVVMAKTGEKGKVVNGRYVSSKITFDSYITCFIGNNKVMAETPEFDCEEKSGILLNSIVNLLFVKL